MLYKIYLNDDLSDFIYLLDLILKAGTYFIRFQMQSEIAKKLFQMTTP